MGVRAKACPDKSYFLTLFGVFGAFLETKEQEPATLLIFL